MKWHLCILILYLSISPARVANSEGNLESDSRITQVIVLLEKIAANLRIIRVYSHSIHIDRVDRVQKLVADAAFETARNPLGPKTQNTLITMYLRLEGMEYTFRENYEFMGRAKRRLKELYEDTVTVGMLLEFQRGALRTKIVAAHLRNLHDSVWALRTNRHINERLTNFIVESKVISRVADALSVAELGDSDNAFNMAKGVFCDLANVGRLLKTQEFNLSLSPIEHEIEMSKHHLRRILNVDEDKCFLSGAPPQ